jgi:hypothetical protein
VVSFLLALLLSAPEADAATLLRIAYASQYEWKEDHLESVTLEFTYDWSWGGASHRQGGGELVVVGQAIVRRHLADLDPRHRERFDEHLDWILARFLRRPFEERFGNAAIQGPEELPAGRRKILADGIAYTLKGDRIVASELNVGTAEAPHLVPVEYESAAVGDGYAIVRERVRYTNGGTFAWTRALETRETPQAPVPASYTYRLEEPLRKEQLTIRFERAEIDGAHPVVRDPEARDRLRAAWERRFVLPSDLRLDGAFQRRGDKALRRAGWSDVEGRFRLWGMDQLDVVLDDRYRDVPRGVETENACRRDLAWAFGLLRDRPFAEEFAGCGFEREGEEVIRVYGHARVLAYRLAAGALAGHCDRAAGEAGWWTYRTRPNRDGKAVVERMQRRLGRRTITLAFRYGRVQGRQLPKRLSAPAFPGGRDGVVGVVEYVLKGLKITPP